MTKEECRKITTKMIYCGEIEKQDCEVCGSNVKVQCHHIDYEDPLNVQWLCYEHHLEAHGKKIRPYDPKRKKTISVYMTTEQREMLDALRNKKYAHMSLSAMLVDLAIREAKRRNK